jgi:hypothetical protein
MAVGVAPIWVGSGVTITAGTGVKKLWDAIFD